MKTKNIKKKNLIVLVSQPLNKFNYYKWSFNKKHKGWNIKYWNILNIENKNLNEKFSSKGHGIVKDKNFINIRNLFHLYEEFKKLPKNFFYINLSVLKFKSSLTDKFLNLKGGICVHFKMNMLPEPSITKKLGIRYILKSPYKLLLLKKIINYPLIRIFNFIQQKFILGKPKIYIAPNENAFRKYKKENPDTKIVMAHSYDYEQYLRNLKHKVKNKNYAVFIDDDIDGHFEFSLMDRGKNFVYSSNEYWSKVEKFLSFVESKFKVKIIIAGHHRRDKRKIPINRKFIFNKTIDLVRNSKLVIMRDSTTIHQAILYKKPIILLKIKVNEKGATTNEAISLLSKLTGANIVNLEKFDYSNKNFKSNSFLQVQDFKYEKYRDYYIKSKMSPNISVWNTVLNELRKA